MKYKNYIAGLVIVILAVLLFSPESKDWIDILGALGPVIVAGLVLYVAYQQYLIEAYKKRTMFYTEKMQALEDLYNLVLETVHITEEELKESQKDLNNSKRGRILQKFYILNIRFRTLFNYDRVEELRNLVEEYNTNKIMYLDSITREDCKKEGLQALGNAADKMKEIPLLHEKIKEEIINIVKI